MTTRAQVISQTFAGRNEWLVEGSYFKILTAAANLQVELYQGAILVLLAPTVKAGFYQRAVFDRIVLTNSSPRSWSRPTRAEAMRSPPIARSPRRSTRTTRTRPRRSARTAWLPSPRA